MENFEFKTPPTATKVTEKEMIDFLLPRAQSFIMLRRWLGYMSVILPIWLIVGGYFYGGYAPTISDFYHSAYRDVFVANLVAIGGLFLVYQGEGRMVGRWLKERHLSILCGLSALGVAFIPNESGKEAAIQLILNDQFPTMEMAKYIHMLCALVFFSCLAVFCICIFTEQEAQKTGRLYKGCGAIIILCIVLIAPTAAIRSAPGCMITDATGQVSVTQADCNWSLKAPAGVTRLKNNPASSQRNALVNIPPERTKWLAMKSNYIMPYNVLFWLEALAVWAFSVAWLVNANKATKRHQELSRAHREKRAVT